MSWIGCTDGGRSFSENKERKNVNVMSLWSRTMLRNCSELTVEFGHIFPCPILRALNMLMLHLKTEPRGFTNSKPVVISGRNPLWIAFHTSELAAYSNDCVCHYCLFVES